MINNNSEAVQKIKEVVNLLSGEPSEENVADARLLAAEALNSLAGESKGEEERIPRTKGYTEFVKIAEAGLHVDKEKVRKFIERYLEKWPETDLVYAFSALLKGDKNPSGLSLLSSPSPSVEVGEEEAWISVDEKPELFKKVIVGSVYGWYDVAHWSGDYWEGHCGVIKPTHWQPLPKPPKSPSPVKNSKQ
jgi:hypothetical protein